MDPYDAQASRKLKLGEIVKSLPHASNLTEVQQQQLVNYFQEQSAIILQALAFVKRINPNIVAIAPMETVDNAIERLTKLTDQLRALLNFNPLAYNKAANDAITDEMNRLRSYFNGAFSDSVLSRASVLTDDESDVSLVKREMQALIEQLRKHNNEASSTVSNLNEASKKVSSIAAEIGTQAFSSVFAEEATRQSNYSRVWLGVLVLLIGFGTWGIVDFILSSELKVLGATELVKYAGAKIFLISVYYVVLAMIARNYAAARHNSIINKHRQNALSIFPALAEGTKDTQTKDTILRHAAEAIFEVQPSGYYGREVQGTALQQVTEILRSGSNSH